MIRLYGHNKGSFRTVTAGLERAFRELGVLEGVFLGETTEFEDEAPGGAQAPIAVACGDPMRILQAHYHGDHQHQFLMLAPNSEGIPPGFVRQLKDEVKLSSGEKKPVLTGLLAPSKWAEGVLQREFPEHRVIYCPHGVLPEFRVDVQRRDIVKAMLGNGVFRILHVTSSRLQRKCTRELISAWLRLVEGKELAPGSCLEILANPEFVSEYGQYAEQVGASAEWVKVVPGQNFDLANYVAGIQGYNFVVQPSRAEGFGLVPLEARACGVPVVATACTGHSDHLSEPSRKGTIIVPHGDVAPSDDYMGATAPTVTEKDILESLDRAYRHAPLCHDDAVRLAEEVAQEWAWERKVAPAVEQMKELIV